MPNATDVLARKGHSVHMVSPSESVLDAVNKMNHVGVGAVVVVHEGTLVGMFTERDVLKRVVGAKRDPASTPVGEVMTTDVITCTPDAEIDDIATLMRNRRIRHVPICGSEGDLLGVISIGDVNATYASNQEATIEYLSGYIYGRA